MLLLPYLRNTIPISEAYDLRDPSSPGFVSKSLQNGLIWCPLMKLVKRTMNLIMWFRNNETLVDEWLKCILSIQYGALYCGPVLVISIAFSDLLFYVVGCSFKSSTEWDESIFGVHANKIARGSRVEKTRVFYFQFGAVFRLVLRLALNLDSEQT
jgi:hypothetical protein